MLNGWDIIAIIITLFVIDHIIEKALLFRTTKIAIKHAKILGVSEEEILKKAVDIVNDATTEVQKLLLEKAKKMDDEVIKLVDAENKNIKLIISENKKEVEKYCKNDVKITKKVVKRENKKKDITKE